MLPAKQVTVRDVEGLIARFRRRRQKHHSATKLPCIGGFAQTVPACIGARKVERYSEFSTDRSIGSDHRHHIAWAIRRKIDQEIRARSRPSPLLTFLALSNKVLLIVVEIRR